VNRQAATLPHSPVPNLSSFLDGKERASTTHDADEHACHGALPGNQNKNPMDQIPSATAVIVIFLEKSSTIHQNSAVLLLFLEVEFQK
jgi:hypothetical protein